MQQKNRKVLSEIKRLEHQAIQAKQDQRYQDQQDCLTQIKAHLLALKALQQEPLQEIIF